MSTFPKVKRVVAWASRLSGQAVRRCSTVSGWCAPAVRRASFVVLPLVALTTYEVLSFGPINKFPSDYGKELDAEGRPLRLLAGASGPLRAYVGGPQHCWPSSQFVLDHDVSISGKGAIRFVGANSGVLRVTVPVKRRTFYRMEASVRAPDDHEEGGAISFGLLDCVGQLAMKDSLPAAGLGDWREVAQVIRTSGLTDWLVIEFEIRDVRGPILVDDLRVYQACYPAADGWGGQWMNQPFVTSVGHLLVYVFLNRPYLILAAVGGLVLLLQRRIRAIPPRGYLVGFLAAVIFLLSFRESLLRYNEMLVGKGLQWYVNGEDNGHGIGVVSDSKDYDVEAIAFAKGSLLRAGAAHHELYPFFLSLLYRIFGHNYDVVKYTQMTLGSLSSAFVFLIGSMVFAPAIGFAAGLYHLGEFAYTKQQFAMLTETLYVFLLTGLFLLFFAARARIGGLAACGLMLGVTALLRAEILSIVPVLALCLIHEDGSHRAGKARVLGAFVLPAIVLVGLMMMKNAYYNGYPFMDSATASSVYCAVIGLPGWGPGAYAHLLEAVPKPLRAGTVYSLLMEASLDRFLDDPWEVVRSASLRLRGFWTGSAGGAVEFGLSWPLPAAATSFGLLNFVAGLVLAALCRNRRALVLAGSLLTILAVQALIGPGEGQGTRYMLALHWLLYVVALGIPFYACVFLIPESFRDSRWLKPLMTPLSDSCHCGSIFAYLRPRMAKQPRRR